MLAGQLLLALEHGGLAGLLASGLALVARRSLLIGLHTAGFFVLGTLGAWASATVFQTSYWTALLLAPAAAAVLGALIERRLDATIFPGQVDRAAAASLGALLAVQAASLSLLGPAAVLVPVPDQLEGFTSLGLAVVPHYRIWVVAASIAAALGGIGLVQSRAALGGAAGAVAAALAAAGGVLSAPIDMATPYAVMAPLEIALVAVVVTEFRSAYSALAASFAIAIMQEACRSVALELASLLPAGCMVVFVLLFRRVPRTRERHALNHESTRVYRTLRTSERAGPDASLLIVLVLAGLILLVRVGVHGLPAALSMAILAAAIPGAAASFLLRRQRMLSFGHAALFGTGSYTCAALLQAGLVWPVAVLAGALAAGAAGGAMGWVAERTGRALCPAVTFVLGQAAFSAVALFPALGGPDGIATVDRGAVPGAPWLSSTQGVVVIAVVTGLLVQLSFGAVRAARDGARLGSRPGPCSAFAISGVAAGLAGCLEAVFLGIALPDAFGLAGSAMYVLMALAGEWLPFSGPALVAIVLTAVRELPNLIELPFDLVLGAALVLPFLDEQLAGPRHRPA